VLLHGIARTSKSLNKLERAIQERGFATLNIDYQSRKKPLDVLAADIHPAIVTFAESIGGPIHFVAHSMGGLLTRVYVARHRPARLGRVVMLGTPNRGSEVADLLKSLGAYRAFFGPAGLQLSTQQDPMLLSLPPVDYDLGIVAGIRTIDPISSLFILPGPSDGKVSVRHTKLDGMTDHIIVKASHPGIIRHRAAIDQTIAFLIEGKFKHPRPTEAILRLD